MVLDIPCSRYGDPVGEESGECTEFIIGMTENKRSGDLCAGCTEKFRKFLREE